MQTLDFEYDFDLDDNDAFELSAPWLEGVGATGQLRGHLLEMRLAQRFHNPHPKPVAVSYTFALPARAVLLGIEARLGDAVWRSRVVRLAQARVEYAQALSEGDSAVMLEDLGDGRFALVLGNLLPNEHAAVTLDYAEPLQTEQGHVRLMLPTTLAPRYGEAFATARPAPDAQAQHALSLSLYIDGVLSRARIGSPTHAIRMRAADEGVHIELARADVMDRDLVLCFDGVPGGEALIARPDPHDDSMATVMATFTPHLKPEAGWGVTEGVTVKLLVDCSCSMHGLSIASARTAVLAVLDALEVDDRFTLSRFGHEVQHRQQAPWRATSRALADARSWACRLEADMGGTELEGALAATTALPSRGVADVLLLTDGQIDAIEGVLAQAQARRHRVFIVGIGSAPCESNLRRLADATGGACVFVAPGEAVVEAMQQMLARMRQPRIEALALQWPAGVAAASLSALPKAAFCGDGFTAYAQVPAGQMALLTNGVRLLGTAGGQRVELGHAAWALALTSAQTLARLSARSRVGDMQEPQATDTALRYQLLTQGTACVLRMERPHAQRPDGMPVSVSVPQMPARQNQHPLTAHPRFAADHSICASTRTARGIRSRLGMDFCQDFDIDASMERTGLAQKLPAAFTAWLKALAPDQWPRSCDELVRSGLSRKDARWLRTQVQSAHAEADVVQAFVLLALDADAGDASPTIQHLVIEIRTRWRLRDGLASLKGALQTRRASRSIK